MGLDMFQQTQSDTDAYVATQTTPRLPLDFGETFEKAWNENRLFGQSIAALNAHQDAVGDYLDDLHKRTGVQINPMNPFGDPRAPEDIGAEVARLKKDRPELDVPDFSSDDLYERALKKSRMARADYQAASAAEKSFGGKAGMLVGGLVGGLSDPVNLAAAPLAAPEGLGLLTTSLMWGAIAGTTQAANEAIGSPYRGRVQPGYSQSPEPAQNILEATGFGAVTGGAFKAIGNVWTRAKTGAWPRSIRDAGNIVESEANVARTNALAEAYIPENMQPPKPLTDAELDAAVSGQPTPEAQQQLRASLQADRLAELKRFNADLNSGMSMQPLVNDVAHREALTKTVDDITAGRPTDVGDIVAPDLTHDPEKVDALHQNAKPFIEAYHGSPHSFEAFSVDKIGTGEGAQAYGHGLYFAEREGVARSYRDKLTTHFEGVPDAALDDPSFKRLGELKDEIDGIDIKMARTDVTSERVDLEAEKSKLLSEFNPLLAAAKEQYGGTLYNVRINADPEHFLDWDKPLSEQSDHVKEAVRDAMGRDYHGNFDQAKSDRLWNEFKNADTGVAIRQGFIAADDKLVAQRLSDAGIPGIKYLDAASRKEGGGSRNFVVFDDKHVQITHKNGVEIGPPAQVAPETVAKDLAHEAPDQMDAMLHDLDKQIIETPDIQMPAGVDQDGNPQFRNLRDMLDEVKADRDSADALQACLTGADEEANGE